MAWWDGLTEQGFFRLAISGVIVWNEFRRAEEECASDCADRWIHVVQPVISGLVVAGASLVNLLAWGRSAVEYLKNMNYEFSVIQYVQASLRLNEKALFLWDGRDYYCDARCVSYDEQSTALRLAFKNPAPDVLAEHSLAVEQAGCQLVYYHS